MFEFEACEVFKTKEFTIVNDCFKNEHNEEIGHSGQALIRIRGEIRKNLRVSKNISGNTSDKLYQMTLIPNYVLEKQNSPKGLTKKL